MTTKKEILFIPCAGPQGHHEGSDYLVTYLRETLGPGYKLVYAEMPDPENPHYESWKKTLEEKLTSSAGDVILIGHSLGGSVLLKYLSEASVDKSISGLFVIAAPYWGALDWEVDEYVLGQDFPCGIREIPNVFLYHSTDDEVVPVAHLVYYTEDLPKATVRICKSRGHLFSKGLPELVQDIKSLQP